MNIYIYTLDIQSHLLRRYGRTLQRYLSSTLSAGIWMCHGFFRINSPLPKHQDCFLQNSGSKKLPKNPDFWHANFMLPPKKNRQSKALKSTLELVLARSWKFRIRCWFGNFRSLRGNTGKCWEYLFLPTSWVPCWGEVWHAHFLRKKWKGICGGEKAPGWGCSRCMGCMGPTKNDVQEIRKKP